MNEEDRKALRSTQKQAKTRYKNHKKKYTYKHSDEVRKIAGVYLERHKYLEEKKES